MKHNLTETPVGDECLSRSQRRAKVHRGGNSKRDIMRQWYSALNMLAKERNDWAIKKKLEEFYPFVRQKDPESKGLARAYTRLVEYGHGVEKDVYVYVKETTSEERSNR